MHTVEFYFDCSSPWTYLAFASLEPLLERKDVRFEWKPFLVGGVFNTVNPSVYANREKPVPVKARYYQKDLQDWADFTGVTIGAPEPFPVNSVKAMRGAFLAIEQGCIVPYARKVFASYWSELRDISQDEVLRDAVESAGMDVEAFFAGIARQEIKDRLRANTDELIERGGFGSPTFFLDGTDMYFGNDRLVLLQAKLH